MARPNLARLYTLGQIVTCLWARQVTAWPGEGQRREQKSVKLSSILGSWHVVTPAPSRASSIMILVLFRQWIICKTWGYKHSSWWPMTALVLYHSELAWFIDQAKLSYTFRLQSSLFTLLDHLTKTINTELIHRGWPRQSLNNVQVCTFLGGPSRIGLRTFIFKKHFRMWCIAAAHSFTLCLERSVLATEWQIPPLFNLGESCTCTLLNRQDVANRRQSRAGRPKQGNVI